jgi:tetratricopeptide (TPR) repeat protein
MTRELSSKAGLAWVRFRGAAARLGVILAATWTGIAQAGYMYDPTTVVEKPAPAQAQPEPTELETAVGCFHSGDLAGCLAALQRARQTNRELFPPQVILAELHLRASQVAQGRAALEQAAALEPNCPQIYFLLARLALGEGRGTEALVLFEKTLALAGTSGYSYAARRAFQAEASAGLAVVAEQRGDWASAASSLTTWLERNPADSQARRRLACALVRLGKKDTALAELRQAVKDDPALDPAPIIMARFLSEAGDVVKASEWVEYGLKCEPQDPRMLLGAALHFLEHDQIDRARAHAESAAKLDPASAAIREARGLIAWHRKDYPTAEQLFQELVVEAPGNLGASCMWALALVDQSSEAKQRRALQLAESLARQEPNSGAVLTTLGWVYHKNGRSEDAERVLRTALQSGSASSETPYYLARILSERGRKDEVGPLLKLALGAPGRFAFRTEAREWLGRAAP